MDELIFMLLMLILVIFTINSFFLQKLEKNYIFIFNIWWLFWLGISYLNIGQFYKIELKTYIYIMANRTIVLVICLGMVIILT